tara:strand:- start:10106 stop:11119 length:1014 start_codon:yes stop_codon:yes gene_type:complete
MDCFFHTNQLLFKPKYEWALGIKIKHPETTRRAEEIYKSLKNLKADFNIIEPKKIPLGLIRATHNYQLITLYNTASLLPEGETFYPSVFPQRMVAKPDPNNIYHSGFYCFDSGTPLNNQTWLAAAWSAASSFAAADHLLKRKSNVAYALSRPPGHHASKDTYGGYCYLNNAAIAANHLKKHGRVVILDLDFHHGNGTQDLFYNTNQIYFISLHGDPKSYFPYFSGYQTETGKGKGRGFNCNIILPNECHIKKYMQILNKEIIPNIKNFEPDYLIISMGFDTYEADPIGVCGLTTEDYFTISKPLAQLKIPTLICQEGGYYTKALGDNVVNFLQNFIS